MSKIIAVSGAHGTGKTTKMYQLAYKHKIQYPGEIGIINEQVRLCPFPINQEADFKSQLWYLTTQIKLELEYSKIYDIVFSDRTIFDILSYSYFCCNSLQYSVLWNFVEQLPYKYDLIVFNTIKNNDYCVNDGVRDMDLEYRQNIEKRLLRIYEELDIDIVKN